MQLSYSLRHLATKEKIGNCASLKAFVSKPEFIAMLNRANLSVMKGYIAGRNQAHVTYIVGDIDDIRRIYNDFVIIVNAQRKAANNNYRQYSLA